MIPTWLENAVDEAVSKFPMKRLLEARLAVSQMYREGSFPKSFSEVERCAYLISRLPATYGVAVQLLEEWSEKFSSVGIKTLLDVGAGPGSASWAFMERFPYLERATLIEQDSHWIEWGKKIAPKNKTMEWIQADITKLALWPSADVVICSYSLGELSESSLKEVLEKCWHCAGKALLIIEPGTPKSFSRIKIMRDFLIQKNAYLVAPCPHSNECPLPSNDWCHFSSRISRTSMHRKIKEGQLAYEDEKFSYLLFTKFFPGESYSRIIRAPGKHSGHVEFTLCTASGIKKEIVSKKSKAFYKQARSLEWGNEFPQD